MDRAVVIRENGRELARRQDRRAQLLEESHIEQGPASLTWVVGVHDSHWEPELMAHDPDRLFQI